MAPAKAANRRKVKRSSVARKSYRTARSIKGAVNAGANGVHDANGAVEVEATTSVTTLPTQAATKPRSGNRTLFGRKVKPVHDRYNATGEECEAFFESSGRTESSPSSDIKGELTHDTHPQPAVVLLPPKARRVPSGNHRPTTIRAQRHYTIHDTSRHVPLPAPDPYYRHAAGRYPADIDGEVQALFLRLQQQPGIQISLPNLESRDDSNIDVKWTAKLLIHLYLIAYHAKDFNICDLVADTWIRALQKANARPNYHLWKDNQATNFKPPSENHHVNIDDPELDECVTRFDQDRLNELYFHTHKNCGARFLWADAMALCGSRIEVVMERMEDVGGDWHKDLVWNIMRTSLRLTRANLTLKIEETANNAWCGRYHEHWKYQQPCYRIMYEDQKHSGKKAQVHQPYGQGGPVQPLSPGHHYGLDDLDNIRGDEEDQMELDGLPHDDDQAKHVSFAMNDSGSEHSEEE